MRQRSPSVVARDGLHLDGPVDLGDAAQLLLDELRLQPALGRQVDVLEVAAAAAAGTGVRAGRHDPVRRRLQHLDGVGAQEVGGLAGDPCADPLPRQAVPDEDDPAVGRPADARATGGDAAQLEVEQLAHERSSTVGRRESPGAGPSSSCRSALDLSW